MASDRGRPRGFDRDNALESALRLFWTKGYEQTSVRDLTAAMGIAPPSLYAAFGDKQRLFLEAVEHYSQHEGAFIEAAFEEESSAYLAVRRVLLEAAAVYTDPDRPRGCIVLNADATHPDLCDFLTIRLRERSASAAQHLRRLLTEADADIDPQVWGDYLQIVLIGMSRRACDGVDRAALERVAQTALAAWPAATIPSTDAARLGSQTG